jgi:hypothetical protein
MVKPESGTSELIESTKDVIRQLSHDDLIILCSGTNDYDLNGFSLIFQNIKKPYDEHHSYHYSINERYFSI